MGNALESWLTSRPVTLTYGTSTVWLRILDHELANVENLSVPLSVVARLAAPFQHLSPTMSLYSRPSEMDYTSH